MTTRNQMRPTTTRAPRAGLAIALDPGVNGAIVVTNARDVFRWWAMPTRTDGKERLVHFDGVHEILWTVQEKYGVLPLFLERAIPMAQGAKSAFGYGRGYESLRIAIELLGFPFTLVEPHKWAKVMHHGVSNDLKPKKKSLVAVKRLFPEIVPLLPKGKKDELLDGPVDALLIAAYGLRLNGVLPAPGGLPAVDDVGDFF